MLHKGSRVARVEAVRVDLLAIGCDIQNCRDILDLGASSRDIERNRLVAVVVRDVDLLYRNTARGIAVGESTCRKYIGTQHTGSKYRSYHRRLPKVPPRGSCHDERVLSFE